MRTAMRGAVMTSWLVALLACGGGAGSQANTANPGDDAAGDDAGGGDALAPGDDGGRGGGGDGASPSDANAGPAPDAGDPTLHIEGNHLVYHGVTTRLLGVDHSGTEYACIQNYAIFEGPDPDTLATAMLTWGHVNTVRLPLNEDCWLGINGVNPMYGGQTYRSAIVDYVNKLHAHGLFVIVDLHWNAPGTYPATAQQPMADADHAVDFWKSVATAFAGDGLTVFDLYNEPYLDTTNAQTSDAWACWLSGCTITQSAGGVQGTWKSAGMQDLVDAVRSTGAKNVLMLGGLTWSNDLSGWLAHLPNDPLEQLAASFHLYNINACVTSSCWNSVVAPIAQQHPVITGELGETDCGDAFVDGYMPWADMNGVSYLGWTWNTWNCSSGPALITDYGGTPTAFGQGIKAHLLVTSP